jgi:mono/diheme cytochrome c family protein
MMVTRGHRYRHSGDSFNKLEAGMTRNTKIVLAVLMLAAGAIAVSIAVTRHRMGGHGRMHDMMHGNKATIFGAPHDLSESWTLARGGLLYDNWSAALDRRAPGSTHPFYPKTGKQSGADTWRCKECHGWDYKGKDGKYAKGSHATGIKGIRGAEGRDTQQIMTLLRAPTHGYTSTMISDDELARVAAFVSRGQHDTDTLIDVESGDVRAGTLLPDALLERGRGIFQTTCAVCHGFEGRELNFGTNQKSAFIGTEAKGNPWEVLHKIRTAHPGAAMISLRAFPIDDAVAVLAYARSLPDK